MNGIATVTIMGGRLTRDPEPKMAGESPLCELGLVVNRSYKKKGAEEWTETAHFFDATVWGSLGDRCARLLKKGDLVYIQGDLEYRSWEAQDGSKRSKVSVNVRQVFSEGLARESGGDSSEGRKAQTPAGDFKDVEFGGEDDIPF